MKDQYFGDRKDYGKFDLMLWVCETAGIRKFSYIPMVSRNDEPGNGADTNYKCVCRPELYQFLQTSVREGRRHVVELRRFMETQRDIECMPYGDAPYGADEPCRHSRVHRKGYFEQIPQSLLNSALVLLDPDTGIEVKSMRPEKEGEYVLSNDLDALSRRMSDDSTLAVFQWANQFICSDRRFTGLARQVLERCNEAECVDWIAKPPVGYLFISKDIGAHARIAAALAGYPERWNRQFIIGGIWRTGEGGQHQERIDRPASPPRSRLRGSSAQFRPHPVHTDEDKETDPSKALGRRPKEQWQKRPDASYVIQCQFCGKWLKGGMDAHVRGPHRFSYYAYLRLAPTPKEG